MTPAWWPQSLSPVQPNPWMGQDRPMDEEERTASRPPKPEAIEWHLTFFAEAYLPSHSAALSRRLTELGWSEQRSWRPMRDPVPSLRTGAFGGGWTSLKTLLPEPSAMDPFGSTKAERLPDGVASLRLWLWSVTPSLTALIVGAEWDEYRGDALDRVAREEHETIAVPSGNGYQMYSPAFRTRLEAKNCRSQMHRMLSSWLTERIPGAFHDLDAPFPFVDVVTTALARPFVDEPSQMYDYRELLSLTARSARGTSSSLPAWSLAMPDDDEYNVLTLGARTVEAFGPTVLDGVRVEESRWGLEHYLSYRLEGLLCGWTTLRLLHAFHLYLAATRDRAPTRGESASAFAKRLANDDLQVLRRGADAQALCADIEGWPPDFDADHLFRGLDFNMSYAYERPSEDLRAAWERQLLDWVALVSRRERDQRELVSTSTELLGVAQNVRTQFQVLILTIALLIIGAITIGLAIAQLAS